MKALIEAGFDVNEQNEWNNTPLMTAVRDGMSGAVIDCLVEAGAEISAGEISLLITEYLCTGHLHDNDFEILDALLLSGSKSMQSAKLGLAIDEGRISVAEKLLEMGVAVNPEEYEDYCAYSETALIAAAKGGHLDLVEVLLDKGAVVGDTCDFGMTARDYAIRNKHPAVVDRLDRALAEEAAAAEVQGERLRRRLISRLLSWLAQ